MRKTVLLFLFINLSFISYSQKSNIAGALQFLESYSYGIPLSKSFKEWDRTLKNHDEYTYITRDFKKYGIIYSNLTTLKNHNTLNGQLDSVLFIMQKAVYTSIDSVEKDTVNNIQIFLVFKKSLPKKIVDTLFKNIELELSMFFPEENINKNKYNNGVKIMYNLLPSDINSPIILERYFDETINRHVINISISKMKNYNME